MKAKVSVIIPVYNVERYIVRCACSLFQQTLKNVEFIFVDDCTPDQSIEILKGIIEKFAEIKYTTKIISHKFNKGLPAARNTGMQVATGDYIFHCDSDDYVEPTMLEALYNEAIKSDAEMVWCDWYLSFKQNERYMHQPEYKTSDEVLKGMLTGSLKYNVWNKLIKRAVYEKNNIIFPEGHAMGEDMTIIRLATCVKSVAYVPQAFYHYVRTNALAYTQNVNKKHLMDIQHNVNETITFIEKNYKANLNEEIGHFKLNIKLPFLISNNREQYKLWSEWYPEANNFILSNNHLPQRTKTLQWMASKDQFWYVWIYYTLVFKFVYGIIYK